MILSKMIINNFRKFGRSSETENVIAFHKGLNALIGENNAGKSAIIDAIKLVLQTQSCEYIRITDDDFHIGSNNVQASEFSIDCVFEEFADNEAKNFIEWLTFEKDDDGNVVYRLTLHFRAWRENKRIYTELKAGSEDNGINMDAKARELLKCVYLRPLRDAAKEMRSGRNSRISQILYSHPVFKDKEGDNDLVVALKRANEDIGKYFEEKDGKQILDSIRHSLQEFSDESEAVDVGFKTSEIKLRAILESLSLMSSEVQPGLGVHNLLFIAAELLLLREEDSGSLKLALIEELEAHLHPQAQLRLMNYLQNEYDSSGVQVIISTHSPILASKINIKNTILIKDAKAYDLNPANTALDKGDYLFLQRFLDSTKSNFFFAKGVIMVEGDAENILLPILADILDCNLEKHGVSLVKVGHTGFFRYSRIFIRNDQGTIGVPVSIVTDNDIEPNVRNENVNERKDETKAKISSIEEKYNLGSIRAFVAPKWTLEYTIAMSRLRELLYKSILEAQKIQNSEKYALTNEKISDVNKAVDQKRAEWDGKEPCVVAYQIYHDTLLKNNISKAIVAQCLASNLRWAITDTGRDALTEDAKFDLELYRTHICEEQKLKLKKIIENDDYIKYLVNAIKHAAGKE